MSNDREELEALRRLAELEDKAAGRTVSMLPLVQQIPGGENAPSPSPEPTGTLLEKIEAGLRTGRNVAAGAVALPVAGWDALLRRGTQGMPAVQQRFEENFSRYTIPPQTPLEAEYTEQVGRAISEMVPLAGIPGEVAMFARSKPVQALRYIEAATEKPVGVVARAPGHAAKNIGAILSAKSPKAISQLYETTKAGGTEAAAAMRGAISWEQTLADARLAIRNAQDVMYEGYKSAKTGWAADKTRLDFKPIDEAFARLEASVRAGKHIMVGSAEQAKIAEVSKVLNEWRSDPSSHTTLGFDALKRRVDAIYPDSPRQSQAQRVITGTRNAVKDTITTQAPDYASAMKSYEEQIGAIRDIEKALSIGDKASKDTAIKRLQTLIRTNNEFRQSMAEQLRQRGGTDIAGQAAGHELSSWVPERFGRMNAIGIGSIGWMTANPLLAATVLPLTSPRVVGELAYGAGRIANALGRSRPQATQVPWALPVRPTGRWPALPQMLDDSYLRGGRNALAEAQQQPMPLPSLPVEEPVLIPGSKGASLTLGEPTPQGRPLPPIVRESPILELSAEKWEPSAKVQPYEAIDYPLLRGARLVSNTEITPKALVEKMMDVQWVADQVQKARDMARGFEDIAKRASNAKQILEAQDKRKSLLAYAEYLEETMTERPKTPKGKALGQRARSLREQQ